ncbi:hypothetical protein KA037_06100 [Patescibacteria group bacterium]|nr:hypothetical protein [Patescibacteria group bacterium]
MINNPYIYLFKQYRRYVEKKHMVVLFVFFFLCANTVVMLEPYFVGKLINTLQAGGDQLLHDVIVILIIL